MSYCPICGKNNDSTAHVCYGTPQPWASLGTPQGVSLQGWICVKFGASNGPYVQRCACSPPQVRHIGPDDSIYLPTMWPT